MPGTSDDLGMPPRHARFVQPARGARPGDSRPLSYIQRIPDGPLASLKGSELWAPILTVVYSGVVMVF